MVESPRSLDQLADLKHIGVQPSIAKQIGKEEDGDQPLLPSQRRLLVVQVSVSIRG